MAEGFGPGALARFRVLDLADATGSYCGRLLAGLGADVIKVEPPGGDPGRRLPPFYHDEPHPERSLSFWYLNTNKRSITLDIASADGRELFLRLAERADVVVETFPPGYLDEIGLGWETLHATNPGLILTSITPFGQTGPYRHFQGSDLIAQAMGGILYLCGLPEDPPVQIGGYSAHYHGSIHAAWGTLIALFDRLATGEGRHVDVSLQESMAATVQPWVHSWDRRREVVTRSQGEARGAAGGGLFRCKDGYVSFGARYWEELVAWMASEDLAGDLLDEKYRDPAYRRQPAVAAHINEIIAGFCARHTVDEVCNEGQRRRMLIFPVFSGKQIVEDEHLRARNWFIPIEHEDLGERFEYPGPPFRLSATPWRLERRAPQLGEHNREVYVGELGLSPDQLAALKAAGVV
jgi:benzylsuccinate CoA-transferase BbsE subunit